MIKIAFCDDSPDILNRIDNLMPEIELTAAVDWDLFSSGQELLDYADKAKEAFNIYVLDIEMPCLDGIDTAKKIRERDKAAVLIFLTDFKEYVYQVFEVLPFRFLEKPVDSGKLCRRWSRTSRRPKALFLPGGRRKYCLVLYCLVFRWHGRIFPNCIPR